MPSDRENELDQDFLFYLGFTNYYLRLLKECGDNLRAVQWLDKLCGEKFQTVDAKRNRNIFLSNLILNMQEGKLSEPFLLNPSDVNMNEAERYFSTLHTTAHDISTAIPVEDGQDGGPRHDGRTYVATRAMPNGEGIFAYVAVSLAADEPRWLGGGEGVFDKVMEEKFKEMVPPLSEMEQILALRRDYNERQRVLTFYDVMLQNIADELDEVITAEENGGITNILAQLIEDLRRKNQYEEYERMAEQDRRVELLLLLFDKTKARRDKVAKREEVLDQVCEQLRDSFFDFSGITDDDKYELPSVMWEYAINRPPNRANMNRLQEIYPACIVSIFMQLLADQKEQIARRMQKRHSNIVGQMKKELRIEGEKFKMEVDTLRVSMEQTNDILLAVKTAYQKLVVAKEKEASRKKGGTTALTALYEEIRQTLRDTQLDVQQEAERGRMITEQINVLNVQQEAMHQVTTCTIMKTEETNIQLYKNIKRLQAGITMLENRIKQIEGMKASALAQRQHSAAGGGAFFME